MRNIQFDPKAFKAYLDWQKTDEAVFDKINELIRDVARDPFGGIGKPEPLKGEFKGFWSRRITQFHSLVYRVDAQVVYIHSVFGHYDS